RVLAIAALLYDLREPAKSRGDSRSSAERNENNRSETRKLVSGNEQGRNDRRHAASRKSRRQISDESRVIVRRGWVGVADRVREPGESFCRPRSSAGARIRHSRRSGRESRTDCETAFSRKLRSRDYRWSARIFHLSLGAGRVVNL